VTRHRDWQHTVLFGDGCCLCSGDGVCRACSSGPPPPQMQPQFTPTGWDDLIATRNPGDYEGGHRK
jgi:hypothetical protein